MRYLLLTILSLLCFVANAQRVFISEDVTRYDAVIYEETDPNKKVSWTIFSTEDINPTIPGNWKMLQSRDSSVFTFKKTYSRDLASFTYRFTEDSTSTNFRYMRTYNSDFFEPVSYMFVNSKEQANMIVCVTPNKWIADLVIYKTNNPVNINPAFWYVNDKETSNTIKVFLTTNREKADVLVYFTDNPLEAQIR